MYRFWSAAGCRPTDQPSGEDRSALRVANIIKIATGCVAIHDSERLRGGPIAAERIATPSSDHLTIATASGRLHRAATLQRRTKYKRRCVSRNGAFFDLSPIRSRFIRLLVPLMTKPFFPMWGNALCTPRGCGTPRQKCKARYTR